MHLCSEKHRVGGGCVSCGLCYIRSRTIDQDTWHVKSHKLWCTCHIFKKKDQNEYNSKPATTDQQALRSTEMSDHIIDFRQYKGTWQKLNVCSHCKFMEPAEMSDIAERSLSRWSSQKTMTARAVTLNALFCYFYEVVNVRFNPTAYSLPLHILWKKGRKVYCLRPEHIIHM